MVDAPGIEIVLVEEMAERPVAHVVEQARDAHRLLDELRGRHIAT